MLKRIVMKERLEGGVGVGAYVGERWGANGWVWAWELWGRVVKGFPGCLRDPVNPSWSVSAFGLLAVEFAVVPALCEADVVHDVGRRCSQHVSE